MIDKILVDDIMMEIKLMEEWGFLLNEDTCLLDGGFDYVLVHFKSIDVHVVHSNSRDIDLLVNELKHDLAK